MLPAAISEDDVEQDALRWLAELGWSVAHGPDISPPDARTPGTERDTYRDVALRHRLAAAIARLNPAVPCAARDDALRQVLTPNVPGLVNANRQVHRWLVDGVPVQFQKDGETRGARVRLIDFDDPAANDWLAVNQFSVQGPKQMRRPDVVLFVNGLPLLVLELKNPPTRTPTSGLRGTSCRRTSRTSRTCSRPTPCWWSATACRHAWVR